MRKAQKQKILDCIDSLQQLQEGIKKALEQGSITLVQDTLSDMQESAIAIGETIEKIEGETNAAEPHRTIVCVEEYCELLFRVFEEIGQKNNKSNYNANKIYKTLRKQLIKIENSAKNDIVVRKEVVFFPYKASMWDSLESIYLAAEEDPECDAYCVPIPYYDLNPDRSFGEMHYEGNVSPDGTPVEYPENIRITDWQTYNFEERRPDVIYIHNPYDNCNLVTSVHPRFYSFNLKKYTDKLVYIPYYVTSGGMLEAQGRLPSYSNIDYIVIQSPQFREYFDKSIPDDKFLPFGSPKVDRVINKCKNPPEPPKAWREKMVDKEGGRKRVFFYNTSISAMLNDTETFLKKMKYVFQCFKGKEDVCLLWRPHPLLESTFDSMRPEFRPVYDELKKTFIENSLGIYDTTPDIEKSIALSDAYIGDAGTSVTSLFGVAGKPIFILNNCILEEPNKEDRIKDIPLSFDYTEQDRFNIIQGNKLYISEPYQYDYKYFCNLAEGEYRKRYYTVHEINGKLYACPLNAQDILVIGKEGVEKKISLEKRMGGEATFSYPLKNGKYLLLLPMNYHAIVRYDTETGEIKYFTDNIDVFVKEKNGQKITGGSLIYQNFLYIASPTDNKVYKLGIENGENTVIELSTRSRCGGHGLFDYEGDIWITPYDGKVIIRWNPDTNEVREYEGFPKNFLCINPTDNSECAEKPFCMPAFYGENIYLSSCWSNMSLQLNINTGEFRRWIPIYESEGNESDDLKLNENKMFLQYKLEENEDDFRVYSFSKHKLYNINFNSNNFQELEIRFDIDELESNESGFCKISEALPYACIENYFNTLSRFIDGTTVGNQFCREKQLAVYRKIIANCDGGCGKKVQEFVKT